MKKIILQPRKNQFLKWLKWELLGIYEDNSKWFRVGFPSKHEAFKEMLEMSKGKDIQITIKT